MNVKTKTLIGAAAVLVLLVGGYFGVREWQKKQNVPKPYEPYNYESIRLTDIPSYDIVKIELLHSGIVLEKVDEIWELVSPQKRGFNIEQYTVLGKLWSMGSLFAERIIEEEPDDLSQYGLDNPLMGAVITGVDGTEAEIFFGNATPGRNSYYTMVKGDPKVYTVYLYYAENFMFSVDDLRIRELLPEFDPQELSYLLLENAGTRIEAEPNTGQYPLVNAFAPFVLTSPYRQPHGTDSDKFGALLQNLIYTSYIDEFVDDEPESLSPYGLDRPGRLYFEVPEGSLDLHFGTGDDGRVYSKFPNSPGVFYLWVLEEIVNTTPFAIVDKFVQIFNIDGVSDFTVSGEGRTIRAELPGTRDDPEFFLNGRKTADKEFRQYYQAVIGLLVDAEYPGPQGTPIGGSDITVTFNFKDAAIPSSFVTLSPFNRDFYSVTQNGVTEFMVSRSQVQNMFIKADEMVYEE